VAGREAAAIAPEEDGGGNHEEEEGYPDREIKLPMTIESRERRPPIVVGIKGRSRLHMQTWLAVGIDTCMLKRQPPRIKKNVVNASELDPFVGPYPRQGYPPGHENEQRQDEPCPFEDTTESGMSPHRASFVMPVGEANTT
jgi:hypothetical protein